MGLIWWILPALAGVVGLMLSFAGLGRLMKLRLAAGGLRFLIGVVFLMGSVGLGFVGLNLSTYKRLTVEKDVAQISFDKVAGTDNEYTAHITLGEAESFSETGFIGDEFQMSARVIRFSPMEQLLGYDSIYRLEVIESRFADRFDSAGVSQATSYGKRLYGPSQVDVYGVLANFTGEKSTDLILDDDNQSEEDAPLFSVGPLKSKDGKGSAPFGSAVYFPMADGLEYKVKITQSALVVEPENESTRRALKNAE